MTDNRPLLFELGTEELPPKTLLTLSNALLANITQALSEAELTFGQTRTFATPRRLAVLIEDIIVQQPDKTIEKRGPAIKAAFDSEGNPSRAALGFATSCGTTVEQLSRLKTDKGEWLSFNQESKGQPATALIPKIINHSLKKLPIAKRMRWGDLTTEFVRPVHWAVLLFGTESLSCEVLGIKTGQQTFGHRFHAPEAILLNHPSEYQRKLLEDGYVIADFEQRKQVIHTATLQAADNVGGTAVINDALLEEITALNEWPVPITGNFDPRFLKLPAEVLITTMQVNQKYFAVTDKNKKLLPNFITFSNIESTNPQAIKEGNERVILPRLGDAEFFWKQDRHSKLSERTPDLANIIFQKTLGTLLDKTQRLEALTAYLSTALEIAPEHNCRAALLAKTDLITEMVGEFPSLQGVMGRYYALADHEPNEVAQALEEQYYPKQSGSPTPESQTGQILAIADKTDTLVGIFSAGLIPTGDKDPYALRRAALGIIRIIIEKRLNINITELIRFSLSQFTHNFNRELTEQKITTFIYERLKGYTLDQGFTFDQFESVLTVAPENLLDFFLRLQAVRDFRELPESNSLSEANKRIKNILRKSETLPHSTVENLVAEQELNLLTATLAAEKDIQPLIKDSNYTAALNRLTQLKEDVDLFFEHIMVNCDDRSLRTNRLALLYKVENLFLKIADISKLQ